MVPCKSLDDCNMTCMEPRGSRTAHNWQEGNQGQWDSTRLVKGRISNQLGKRIRKGWTKIWNRKGQNWKDILFSVLEREELGNNSWGQKTPNCVTEVQHEPVHKTMRYCEIAQLGKEHRSFSASGILEKSQFSSNATHKTFLSSVLVSEWATSIALHSILVSCKKSPTPATIFVSYHLKNEKRLVKMIGWPNGRTIQETAVLYNEFVVIISCSNLHGERETGIFLYNLWAVEMPLLKCKLKPPGRCAALFWQVQSYFAGLKKYSNDLNILWGQKSTSKVIWGLTSCSCCWMLPRGEECHWCQ